MLPNREDIIAVVEDWAAGRRTTRSVHEWAEQIEFEHTRSPDFVLGVPYSDPVVEEVIGRLGFLNEELLTPDDGPHILAFLNSPLGDASAWQRWQAFRQSLWSGDRRRLLADDPYYNT